MAKEFIATYIDDNGNKYITPVSTSELAYITQWFTLVFVEPI